MTQELDNDGQPIGAMLRDIGVRWVELNAERSVTEMPYSAAIALPRGGFFGGALLAMADPTANVLCIFSINPTRSLDGPRTVTAQVNAHLMRNSADGPIRAEARFVHKGRRTMVVQTDVRDARGKQLMLMTSTHIRVD